MPELLFAWDDLERATAVVRRQVPVTPSYAWPLLADALGTAVWVKHENHTPTGAFKMRGGLVLFDRLVREEPDLPGVISATRGNHGQSLAFAGRLHDVPVTIVVPHGNSPEKNASMAALGAELIVHGDDYQAAREHAQVLADERGLRMVGPFEPDLVLGVATYARELFADVADLDVVYVPVGMGSGICGVMTVRDLLGLSTEVVGVVASGAPATLLSFEAGHPVATETVDTFVDGVATRIPDPVAVEQICGGAARVVAVDDGDTREAMRIVHRATHQLAEPAGALAFAGALAERDRCAGRRVAVVQSGGNADADLLVEVLSG